jgi:hypothetical protein
MPEAGRRDFPGLAGALAGMAVAGLVVYDARNFSELGRVFPITVALVVLIAGTALSVRILWGQERAAPPPGGSNARRLALVVSALVWVALLQPLGFVLASLVGFLAASAAASFERPSLRLVIEHALAALLLAGGAWLLFVRLLQVPLP